MLSEETQFLGSKQDILNILYEVGSEREQAYMKNKAAHPTTDATRKQQVFKVCVGEEELITKIYEIKKGQLNCLVFFQSLDSLRKYFAKKKKP